VKEQLLKMVRPLDSIAKGIAKADDWEKKGEFTWVQVCMDGALMGYLQHAVRKPGRAEALAWLSEHGFEALLNRSSRNLKRLCDEVDAGRQPSSVIGGNYRLLVRGDLGWLLGEYELGSWYLAVARRPDVLEISSPFWREYSRAVEALAQGVPYTPENLKLRRRHENCWSHYLSLIAAASRQEPLGAALRAVDDSFLDRNEHGNIEDDSYGIEGCAGDPVCWDFRRDALLECIRRHRREGEASV
jgi:hypothetical protein